MAVIGEFNMLGRVAVVTGGNSGLGFETAQKLAAGGADVVLACRDYRAAVAAKKIIQNKSKVGEEKIHPMLLDLANLQSVKTFAEEIREKFKEIHVLVCNAGVMVPSQDTSNDNSENLSNSEKDEHSIENASETTKISEIHFVVNHLGHFSLVHHLLPTLLQSSRPRLVVVSSMLLKEGKIELDKDGKIELDKDGKIELDKDGKIELDKDGKIELDKDGKIDLDSIERPRLPEGRTPPAYANSKLMNALFAREAQRRWPGLSVYCVSPGWCRTSLHRNTSISWWQYPLMALPLALFSRSASSGSDCIVYCAAGRGDYLENNKGKFFRDRKVEESVESLLDSHQNKIDPLWSLSEKLAQMD